MTNADHDPLGGDEAFADKLRAALDPRLGADAAERIADGAWQRTHEDPAAPPVRRLPRRGIRYAAAAAVLLAVAAGGIVSRPASDAFAVEGDPVRVWNGGDWKTTKNVRGDATVFAPQGTRALLGHDGARIEPTAGAVFRIVLTDDARFEVRVMRGSVSVSGGSHRLVVGDFEAQPQSVTAIVTLRGAMISGEPISVSLPTWPFPEPAGAVPQVEAVVGTATVRNVRTGERRALAPLDLLTLDAASQRMLSVQRWDEAIATRVLLGAMPVGASPTPRGDAQLVLHGIDSEIIATLIPQEQIPRAFALVNYATFENLRATPRLAVAVHIGAVTMGGRPAFDPAREIVHEKDGIVTALRIYPDGTVEVESGGRTRVFPSLDAARSAEKATLARFADYLEDTD